MKFQTDSEPWTTYKLEDGTEVRTKIVLVSVKRKDGHFQPDGQPAYDIGFQQIVHVEAPEHLRLARQSAPSSPTPN